ncbi:MAG: L,D-transpeptidase family protein, partial [Eubacteriales bacterium]|nr:L,D-transpeptidase family protein [Eubacteriales bacterium]
AEAKAEAKTEAKTEVKKETKKAVKFTDRFKSMNKWVKIGIAAVVVVVVGEAVTIGSMHAKNKEFYKDHFFKETYINGMDVSDMTAAEVEDILKKQAEDYSLQILFKDDQTETLTKDDLGYTYISDGTVQKLMEAQDPDSWYSQNRVRKEASAAVEAVGDEAKIRESVEALPEMQVKDMIHPEDAQLSWNSEECRFVVTPEVYGTVLSRKDTVDAALTAVKAKTAFLNIEALGYYRKPTVFADDKKLTKEAEELNKYVAVQVTYHLPQGDKVLDGTVLKDWLDVDENGTYQLNETKWYENIYTYVEELAEETDTIEKEHTFRMNDGRETKVDGTNAFGWEINRTAEVEALTGLLEKKGKASEREPEYISREIGTAAENNGLGSTYVEVNLTKQHLWFYENNKVVIETDVVSGMMNGMNNTPEGIFFCTQMQSPSVLIGPQVNGKAAWASPVSVWMRLTDNGVGLHDATWQEKFGGTRYLDGFGSHGCVNLPVDKAKEIYQKMKIGEIPVVIFYEEE